VYGSGFNDIAQKKIRVERVCHKMVTAWTLKSMLCKLMAMRAVSCVCELRPALNVPINRFMHQYIMSDENFNCTVFASERDVY
jgi:hypothetical protein